MRSLYWFRNDLRLTDNPALTAAAESGEVVPVYIIDEALFTTQFGIPRIGQHRLRFLLDTLAILRNQLIKVGSNLVVEIGNPAQLIPSLAARHKASVVWANRAHGADEKAVEEKVAQQIPICLFSDGYLIDRDHLPFELEALPDVFTVFRKKIEERLVIQPPLKAVENLSSPPLAVSPLPQPADVGCPSATLHPLRIDDFKGGETGALERLVSYCATRDGLGRYKETRNGLLGNYSSRFSPWLALGCLSPRMIMDEVRKHEARFGANESTYWMQFELLWRDYFRLVFEKYQNRLFQHGGLKQRPTGKADAQRFVDWCNGKTRCKFVNANMNELRETGWMSNRGRQNVASYLVHDLGVDWRWGAAWFEYLLLDYDVCSNYGNWNYVAGIGNDPRPNRKFNTSLQQSMYDPDGTYTRTWLNVVSQPRSNL